PIFLPPWATVRSRTAESPVPPVVATGGTRPAELLVDADNFLRDGGDARLRCRNNALPVLVRLLVGDDRANIIGSGEFLDRRYRLSDVEIVVVADRQLLGVQHSDLGATGVQRVGGPGCAL